MKKEQKVNTKITVKFPEELYTLMKKNVMKNGQTFTGYLVNLVAEDQNFELEFDD